MENFAEISDNFIKANACLMLPFNKFYDVIKRLLNDEKECKKLGENAYNIIQQNIGTTNRILQYILNFIN